MELKDSGARREFTTGAVRDIAEGKGRCDLLPLDVLAIMTKDDVLSHINKYIYSGCVDDLMMAIESFNSREYGNFYSAMLQVAKQYEDGAKKYDDRNWEKGMPLHCFIDSGVRHYLKHRRGDDDEPHNRAFLFNMLGAIWTHLHKPELIDLPFAQAEGTDD